MEKIRLQPCQILQGITLLVAAVSTPDTSDEARCSAFMQLWAVRPDGLITQLKAGGDKGMKTTVEILNLPMAGIIFTLWLHNVSYFCTFRTKEFYF